MSSDRLIEVLWGDKPPATASSALYNHVMRLRSMLGEGSRIQSSAGGYLIRVGSGELDLPEFLDLCDEGRTAAGEGRWTAAHETLTAALALWRGDPLSDLPGSGTPDGRLEQLRETRLQALEGRFEATVQLGRPGEVIGELLALTSEYPTREAFHRQLMTVLHMTGRQVESLEAYRRLRNELVEEFGVEPSPETQTLHQQILKRETVRAATGGTTAPAGRADIGAGRVIGQLPTDVRAFVGRGNEMATLLSVAGDSPDDGVPTGVVTISAINGMGGVGRTAPAVHMGHRLRNRFPDGQLYIDLQAHTSGPDPLSTRDALNWLLRSLGIPPQLVPATVDGQVMLYRHRLAGTRTLIILDNATSAAQVRPLLPGTSGCLVIVTSRERLAGLDDAHTVTFDILPEPNAVTVVRRVTGPDRIPADHSAPRELIALC
ncbi:AfsR/SARP family transcriptional regulator [Streptacidiphilus sp. P02-A3a]|nr:AfsR/SARP family transcriptional regulator [Streptacidiphilus sp. P02-A3a]